LKAADQKPFDDLIYEVLRLAGDTDTNCCIVGGMLGAYTGRQNLDQAKISMLFSCDISKGI
jgi:ADP-ribosylglycohydrolase